MIKRNFSKSLLFFSLMTLSLSTLSQVVRIACIGNNITYGEKVVNRERNNYPVQLQRLLGKKFKVSNFGVSEKAIANNVPGSYQSTIQFTKAIEFNPDIVFCEFGAIDTRSTNREHLSKFKKSYAELIGRFQQNGRKPRIVLLLPLPSFSVDQNEINEHLITSNIIPIIQQLAFEKSIELIDLHSLFLDDLDSFPDSIHLSSNGITKLVKRLYDVVMLKQVKGVELLKSISNPVELKPFYGFEMIEFKFAGRDCKVVQPKKTVNGLPWIWRARFWGHEPQTDIALLERGFHLVYCDVAELYGNSQAVEIWNRFYDWLQQLGFSKKATLEGMSRGGVYIYNWALANPTKVACIYADAPVLDLRSWPGGKGKSPGSKSDWEIFKKDYQLDENSANQFAGSPLNKAGEIARLGIPLLHVVGDDDEIVPIDENTLPFEKLIKENGGQIKVIHKPGVKHHPHSLANPTPIVEFILRANNLKTNFAKLPIPGTEYRSAAGWLDGKDWWAQFAQIDSLLISSRPDILFLGNSITQGLGGRRSFVTYKPGFKIFDSIFSKYKWESAGISGDRTQNLLWRLINGKYKLSKPKLVVVTIGVNNFNEDDTPEEIVAGIKAIIDYIRNELPATKIIVSGPLPTGMEQSSDRRIKYDEIQRLLNKLPPIGFTYLPLCETFLKKSGELSLDDYAADGIHLVEGGYHKWAKALYTVIEKYLR